MSALDELIKKHLLEPDDVELVERARAQLARLRAVAEAAREYMRHLPAKFMEYDENSLTPTGHAIRKLAAALDAALGEGER